MKSKQIEEVINGKDEIIRGLYKIFDKLEQRIATLEKVLESHAKCIGEIREEKMSKKELEKEYKNIIGKQIEEQEEVVEDMYPIQSDVLAVALDYIPTKVLKRIIARYK